MSDRDDNRFKELAEFAKTLGHAHRLLLLEHIAQGERAVERLAELSGLSVANASQHLQLLRRAGFVETRRSGKKILYRLSGNSVIEIVTALQRYADHSQAMHRQGIANRLADPDRLETVSRGDLLQMLDAQQITLLDVRSEEEFALGHIMGATHIPLDELLGRMNELRSDYEIIAYCRGPNCVLSIQAVQMLTMHGYQARRFADGLPQWRASGLPLA
ncbi:ArsR/SmtB family transcription factor [Ancylobacter mangrovi]|uniref:ArsR/SmtB family transcription factor n=1 Tax=Ancylobacter mangrovi TaxID=2972472 RepID=UPI0021626577|nr:metalloregulator ArsR/SmtB family transcription factor [Ancylobacter mangrovi]MCS0505187.1 metalloregulator ArsR/SmtB family transcription factor [Ancylobacter mangrovi]